ncbi:hypothetical protein C7974DRAFT_419695 [Boeremia exigua]|uniref:uncharacterized protein n=1 Tax=Boeremia exigua TaxID=749465 RepID=UPI001E8EA848|nr:uncharacterized protein C7974DRAFT_419695 [Boeremia exigua]KAH6644166.1 hypothetical protein C7974DRAFT_419695 [Boeremia exigua]
MSSEHRKIDLQSPADLTHIESLIRRAAAQKLDLHLPAQPSDGADDLRAQTGVLVDAFVDRVLGGVRANVAVNGIEVVEAARGGGFEGEGEGETMSGVQTGGAAPAAAEEFEPFDERLRARLAEHVARRDRLVKAVSAHRRATAGKAARAWEERFEAESTAQEVVVHAARNPTLDTTADAQDQMEMETQNPPHTPHTQDPLRATIPRADEVQRNWARAVEGLGRLNQGLPETRARLERCGGVVEYLGAGSGAASASS